MDYVGTVRYEKDGQTEQEQFYGDTVHGICADIEREIGEWEYIHIRRVGE